METFGEEEGSDMVGQPWNVLFDGLEDEEAGSEPVLARPLSPQPPSDAKRLPVKDMFIFGRYPETDPFVTVVCSYCGRAVMPHAFQMHIRLKHGDKELSMKSLLTATPTVKTAKNTSPLKKSASSSPTELANEDALLGRTEPDCVVCTVCSTLVAAHALRKHVLKHHGDDSLAKPPIPSPIKIKTAKKPSPKKPSKSISSSPPELVEECPKELKKNNGKTKKCKSPIPPELEPILPPSKRIVLSSSGPPELMPIEIPKKINSKKKIERKADKVFDPNKHCGVINDAGKPCLRSILCKVHLVAHKRAVQNRSMPYDALTKLLKSQNDEEKRPKSEVIHTVTIPPVVVKEPKPQICVVSVPSVSNETWTEQPILKQEEPAAKRPKTEEDEDQYALPSDLDALIEATLKDVEENEPLPVIPVPRPEPLLRWSLEPPQLPPNSSSPPLIIQPDEIPWHSSHPRPLATNTFGCRLVGGLLSKCKKLDAFRKHVQAVWTSPGRGGLGDSPSKINSFTSAKANVTVSGKRNPLASGTPRRKRKNSGGSAAAPPNTSTSDIISGLLQRAGPTNNAGVPLRLFQSNLPGQQQAYIQFNLCPSK